MELAVLDKSGKKTSKKVTLNDGVFGIEPNDHAIYLDVKQYLAAQRQGTHKAKERSEITGSTRKLFRQKGTGNARRGSIKSPLLKGGGRVFGPRPRNYDIKLNKKVKRLARRSALSYKAKSDSILVLKDLNFDAPRTKDFRAMMQSLELDGSKVLFVTGDAQKNTVLSARNLPGAEVVAAKDLNTFQVMNSKKVVIAEDAVKVIEESLNS